MKKSTLIKMHLAHLVEDYGIEKATALADTYIEYIRNEFDDDRTDEDLIIDLSNGDVDRGVGIAYTTSEDEGIDFQTYYHWADGIYTYVVGAFEEIVLEKKVSIDYIIEHGFDYDADISICQNLLETYSTSEMWEG